MVRSCHPFLPQGASWNMNRLRFFSGDSATAAEAAPAHRSRAADETVVLIHGMLSSPGSMQSLARALAGEKFHVHNWGYPSLRASIAEHARRLQQLLRQVARGREGVGHEAPGLHLVTHSMGGIIARAAIGEAAMPRVARMVMLAPPNRGSHLTRWSLGPFAKCFPPLSELTEGVDSLVNRLPPPREIEVGIIAAARDAVVHLESTRLEGMKDHLIVPTNHRRLPRNAQAITATLQFLREGRFGLVHRPPTRRAA
jgi:pimeloyl-ACP methyl ester carboxylesterase